MLEWKMRQNRDVTMSLITSCRQTHFENAKIGLGLCAFYACEFQTKQPIAMKFIEIFSA